MRFRITSPDVLHGFQIVGTNVNLTVAPGYVSEATTTFREPGEYLVVCNEHCGLGHHNMTHHRRGAGAVTGATTLVLSNFWVAVVAFAVGSMMAVMQALARAGVELPFGTASLYYLSVTAHGVLLALVFTTFFIMAIGYLVVETTLGRIAGARWAWAGFWVAVVGTVITTIAILSGTSTVLYTFYPPLLAHPAFYIGATLLVVGSWIWCGVMIASFVARPRRPPGVRVPLAAHGMLTTVIIWILATIGLAVEVVILILPWSVGLVDRIDPIVARTYFWWFGHPLTYFWLVPAYVLWYTITPRFAGGRLFSDALTRVVFIQFILFSTPVGFHHQFTDPAIASGWKLVHTFTTCAIMFPSLVTAFTVIASLEWPGGPTAAPAASGGCRGCRGATRSSPRSRWRWSPSPSAGSAAPSTPPTR